MAAGRRVNRWPLLGLLGLLTIVAATYLVGGSGDPGPATTVVGTSELPLVELTDLPREVTDTVDLIAVGGPLPYERDGASFGNRERLLPLRDEGYYREYTVPTPGEDDRGARRIVTGRDGELYFTADHYDSFVRVRAP